MDKNWKPSKNTKKYLTKVFVIIRIFYSFNLLLLTIDFLLRILSNGTMQFGPVNEYDACGLIGRNCNEGGVNILGAFFNYTQIYIIIFNLLALYVLFATMGLIKSQGKDEKKNLIIGIIGIIISFLVYLFITFYPNILR